MLFSLAKISGGNEPSPINHNLPVNHVHNGVQQEPQQDYYKTGPQQDYYNTEKHPHNGHDGLPDHQFTDTNLKEHIDTENLKGVQKIEAVTLVWSKGELIVAYACIFLVFVVNSLQQQITNNLTAYVYSDFASHSLIPVTSTVAFLLAGILKLPVAQMMNLWGRAEGLIFMLFCATLGLIMMAGCKNVATYCAAQVSSTKPS